MMFLILPVTIASVEGTFGKLELIEDRKMNSTNQIRIRDRVYLLCIEHNDVAKIDFKDIICDFANVEAMKEQF